MSARDSAAIEPQLTTRLEWLGVLFGVELADRIRNLTALAGELEQSESTQPQAERVVVLRAFGRELHSLKGAAQADGAEVDRAVRTPPKARYSARSHAAAVDPSSPGLTRSTPRSTRSKPCAPSPRPTPRSLSRHLSRSRLRRARPIRTPIARARSMSPPGDHAPAPTAPPQKGERTEQNSVRVSLEKLDTLLTESGELSVTHLRIAARLAEVRELQRQLEHLQRDWRKSRPVRARLRRGQVQSASRDAETLLGMAERSEQEVQSILQRTRGLVGDLSQNISQLGAVAGAIGEEVIAIRLLPAGTIFLPLERLVRDVSRQTGKDARLVLTGTDTDLDRRILDELRDPLMHMVRNTIDHGIEAPRTGCWQEDGARHAAHLGRPARRPRPDRGRGRRPWAGRRGNPRHRRAAQPVDLRAGCAARLAEPHRPDLPSRFLDAHKRVGAVGRGVGMDVVREHVNRLGGDISVRTSPGIGTSFTVTVPLTLATTRVLLVEDAGQTFAIPSSSIERTGRIRLADVQRLEGRRALKIDGRMCQWSSSPTSCSGGRSTRALTPGVLSLSCRRASARRGSG